MKITAIDTVVVHAEMRNWVFVKLSTDEGLVGWGESTVEWKTRAVVGCIEDYRTLLVGEDPRRVEHIWQMMYRQHFFRPGMVECSAMSGIEHACWDIAGKALGAPVHQLLGGAVRDTVRLYDHLGGGEMVSVYHTLSAEEAREKIRESLELGFDAIKLEVVIPRTGRVDGIEALRHADSVMAAVREEAGDGVEAFERALQTQPDLCVMDVSMPRMTGLQAARQIRAHLPATQVLALSMHDDERYVFDALKAGASGYVLKREVDSDLLNAIRAVHRGDAFLTNAVERSLVREWMSDDAAGPEEPLTPREQEVLKLIAEAYTNKQIAEILHLAEKTVESHRANLLRKLGMRDRVELVRYAIRRGLTEA